MYNQESSFKRRIASEQFEKKNDYSNCGKRYQQEPFSAKKITNKFNQAFHKSLIFLLTAIANIRAQKESVWKSAH
jgi:hypothetical protein